MTSTDTRSQATLSLNNRTPNQFGFGASTLLVFEFLDKSLHCPTCPFFIVAMQSITPVFAALSMLPSWSNSCSDFIFGMICPSFRLTVDIDKSL